MIARRTTGGDARGLVAYLLGPGRENEHEDMRVVFASDQLLVPLGQPLTAGERRQLADQMAWPADTFGTEIPGGYVWHLSLTNAVADRELSDSEWAEAARFVAVEMGFDDPAKAGVRLFGARHGRNTTGCDHLHLQVTLIRDDGTRVSTWRDLVKLSKIAGQLEGQYGLTVVEGRSRRDAMPGLERGETERAAREGRPESARTALQRAVRDAAVVAADESEFVRRLTAGGVLVRPRLAAQSDQVTGYAVAVPPTGTGQPIWYGGGSLAKDLRLPALRQHWAPTADATRTWREFGTAPASPANELGPSEIVPPGPGPAAVVVPREQRRVPAGEWASIVPVVAAIAIHLQSIPIDDEATWALTARETAGVLGAWSTRLEPTPGPLADAADALARSAQTPPERPTRRPERSPLRGLRGVAMVAAQAGLRGDTAASWGLLAAQLVQLTRAIGAAQAARGDAHRAVVTAERATARLEALIADWADRSTPELVPAGTPVERDPSVTRPQTGSMVDQSPPAGTTPRPPGRRRPPPRTRDDGLER